MPVICPKCSHARPADSTNPDWQCPACGVCYAKFGSSPVEPARPGRNIQVDVKRRWNLSWLIKITLLIALGWGLSLAFERRQNPAIDDEVDVVAEQESQSGVEAADAIIRLSSADASLLHSLSGRLEKACARNKYGLTESACIARLRERQDVCASKTAQGFPGQIGNTDRMQTITQAYVACIFES